MPNIETFKGQFTNLARMNRFKVEGFGLNANLKYFAKGATLPATTVPAMPVNYQGRVINLDGDRTYEPLELTVYGDEAMSIRKEFELWSEIYNHPVDNTGTILKREGFITLTGRDGTDITKFLIVGALCTTISSVSLDWGTNDTPLEFNVTIEYDYHQIVG